MSDVDMVQKILLNLGDKTPVLVGLYMIIRWMWPDVKSLLDGYLQARLVHSTQPDPLAQSVVALSVRIDAMMQGVTTMAAVLSGYVDESRRSNLEMSRMVQVVVGLVGDVARDRLRASVGSAQPPVSPLGGGASEGADVGASLVRA